MTMKVLVYMVSAAAMIMILSVSGLNAATFVVQDRINEVSTESSSAGGYATTVDYWALSLNSTGTVTIDTLSFRYDFDGDGISYCMDPKMFLFKNDGDLSADDWVFTNDDASSLDEGDDDGSVADNDSFWSGELDAGNYILAISDYRFNLDDAIDGINNTGYGPYEYTFNSDDQNDWSSKWEWEYPGQFKYADYQITFKGFDSVSAVPVPGSGLLLAAGLLGAAGWRRRKNG